MSKESIEKRGQENEIFVAGQASNHGCSRYDVVVKLAMDCLTVQEIDRLVGTLEAFAFARESVKYREKHEIESRDLIRGLREMLEEKKLGEKNTIN